MVYGDAWVGSTELLLLQPGKVFANLDDVVPCTFVHVRVVFSEVVEDIQCERTVPRPNLIHYEVFVWEVLQEILRYEALSDGPSVPRLPT